MPAPSRLPFKMTRACEIIEHSTSQKPSRDCRGRWDQMLSSLHGIRLGNTETPGGFVTPSTGFSGVASAERRVNPFGPRTGWGARCDVRTGPAHAEPHPEPPCHLLLAMSDGSTWGRPDASGVSGEQPPGHDPPPIIRGLRRCRQGHRFPCWLVDQPQSGPARGRLTPRKRIELKREKSSAHKMRAVIYMTAEVSVHPRQASRAPCLHDMNPTSYFGLIPGRPPERSFATLTRKWPGPCPRCFINHSFRSRRGP